MLAIFLKLHTPRIAYMRSLLLRFQSHLNLETIFILQFLLLHFVLQNLEMVTKSNLQIHISKDRL